MSKSKLLDFNETKKIIIKCHKYLDNIKDYRQLIEIPKKDKEIRKQKFFDIIDKSDLDNNSKIILKNSISKHYNISKYKLDKNNISLNNAINEFKTNKDNLYNNYNQCRIIYDILCVKYNLDFSNKEYLIYNIHKLLNLSDKEIFDSSHKYAISKLNKLIKSTKYTKSTKSTP